MKTALILISEGGKDTARKLTAEWNDMELYSPIRTEGYVHIASLASWMEQAFGRYDAFVFIGAMGICVRTIAPHIRDKHTDPAVLCVDSTGRYVVSVLAGHIGGANGLTEAMAHTLGAEPVITTQSDRTGLWALDTLEKRFDWHTQPLEGDSLNTCISLFVAGKPTALLLEIRDKGTDWLEAHLPAQVQVFTRLADIDFTRFQLLLCVSPRIPSQVPVPTVCYVPAIVHVGLGLARQAGPTDEVIGQVYQTLAENGICRQAIASLSSITEKKDEPVLQALGKEYPVTLYPAEELAGVDVPHPSETVQKHMGTYSVSEAAAILSSGNPHLLLPKSKGSNYTVAVSVDSRFLRQGHIEIVGAGPGDPELISVRGKQMLERADLVLYAGSLVPRELTAYAKPGATVRSSASMDLEAQFELMKDFYDRGKFIVRLHTGDPCIYGAIQEQMNYFDQYGMSYHITPGISSFQAAAAALKSQFTIPEKVQSIILTRGEGRTPMPEREKLHLMARSQSTMCIFLSAGIADQVQAELLQEYPETTPVAVCYHLTWPDERIFRGELKDLARIVSENRLTLTTMIVVGEAIGNREGLSRLYAHEFKHLYRP